MDKECKNIDIYIILLILLLFSTMSFVYFNINKTRTIDFIMLGAFFITIIFSYFKGIIWGVLISSIFIFFYGTYVLYANIVLAESVEVITYVWMVVIPLSGIIGGKLSLSIVNLQNMNSNLKKQYRELVTIDRTTGLSNIRGFYMDLNREISKSKRHKYPLSLMIIRLNYYGQLMGILGDEKMQELLKEISSCITSATRIEDIRYKISQDTLAILMTNTNIKGGELVKERIKENIKELNLKINEKGKSIIIDVKIGVLEYNQSMENSFKFKDLTEKELEYDVD